LLGALLLLAGCGRGGGAASAPATGAVGGAATGPVVPRIVSTVPAATLNLVLIGGDKLLVGVSSYDRLFLPESERNLPVVGDYEQTNYEQLVKLQPTVLIIQQEEARQAARLKELVRDHHVELLNMKFDHVADIWTSVRMLGKAAGREAEAEKAIARAQQELKDVAVDYKDAEHPKVLYIMDPAANLACGTLTYVDEMITLAGGQTAPVGDGFVTLGRETMVKLAPDVLLIGAPDAMEEMPNDPRLTKWLDLPAPATRNKRVFLVTDGNSQMPSVDIGKNVRALAELIHRNAPAGAAGGIRGTALPDGGTQGNAGGAGGPK
jgi:iron complex transport system substrate-binding protein